MTPDQVHLIRHSFAEMSRYDHIAALIFYRKLFEIDPSLRRLFVGDIEEQAKKLTDMLGVLISMLESPPGMEMELRAMGVRHAGYGVNDEHYGIVAEALLGMLAEVLGHAFTPGMKAAWCALYSKVEAAMRQGAAESEAALSPAM